MNKDAIIERQANENLKLVNDNADLRQRIDKAIEYIEENMSYIANGKKDYVPSGEDLLDILKGSEDNE